jgi:glucokinase
MDCEESLMPGQWIMGLDIGGTKTAVTAGGMRGDVIHREQFATEPGRGFDDVFARILEQGDRVVAHIGTPPRAVSVSIGGPLDVLRGIVKSPPNLPGWNDVPLKELLSVHFRLPVYVEHDGNAGALAEWYFGAGKGFRNIVFVTMGTGFGAGLILDGRLYRGTSDVAGEIGHVRVAEDGPDCYGKSGSLEGYGSGTGIARLAGMMYPSLWDENATVIDVHDAYRRGSPEAASVFSRAATGLGRGLAIVADMLNPERIILGGLGMRCEDALVRPARRVFDQESLPAARRVCRVVPAGLGETIGDVASLCAAYDQGSLLDGAP